MMNCLLLADKEHCNSAVHDHIDAICSNSKHQWVVENPVSCRILNKIDLNKFDAIGLHYSIRAHQQYFIPKALYKKIKECRGIKFQFLQDEYRQVEQTSLIAADLGINVIFTLVPKEKINIAYPFKQISSIKIVSVLTAYAAKRLNDIQTTAIADRNIDIFYRSRQLPFHLGNLARDKTNICTGAQQRAKEYRLKIDVSCNENDRLYGKQWISHLTQARCTLATESGASIWDYSGEVEKQTVEALKKDSSATYQEIHDSILYQYEGNMVYNAISPRLFEAAALKTPLVMFPGEYNGIFLPERDYIVLEKDFSNFDDVVDQIRDTRHLQALADRVYKSHILSKLYCGERLALQVDQTFEKLIDKSRQPANIPPHVILQHIHTVKTKYRFVNILIKIHYEIKYISVNLKKCFTNRSYGSLFATFRYASQIYWRSLKTRFFSKRPVY